MDIVKEALENYDSKCEKYITFNMLCREAKGKKQH
jgi:hypothetical protein